MLLVSIQIVSLIINTINAFWVSFIVKFIYVILGSEHFSFQIGEEHWTTVSHDGRLLDDRTVGDFLIFDTIHHNIRMKNAYVAYWITKDDRGHYETFGHAYSTDQGVCARFVDRNQQPVKLCGGFRVLSRSIKAGIPNPFKFVRAEEVENHQPLEYRGRQIAKIVSWQKNEGFYGSANIAEQTAEGIDYEDSYVQVYLKLLLLIMIIIFLIDEKYSH
ncbi:unnamed protein product [Dracunculus medinensis]|uniref:Neprosin domain-containing protein n=1 Tax=Dracunculus medinensis TaxID=318479 RepID=A0A0N4U5L6_DRAME|nr:unnamed protein product [Dracunculus medinensis]